MRDFNVTVDTGDGGEVRSIDYSDIPIEVMKMMRKDGLNFTSGGYMLGRYVMDSLIAIVGFKVSKQRGHLLVDYNVGWVHPYWRGKGIYRDMFTIRDNTISYLFDSARNVKFRTLASDMSYDVFIENGFREADIDSHDEQMSIDKSSVRLRKLVRD